MGAGVEQLSPLQSIFVTSVSAVIAESCTLPLDTTKVRMQMDMRVGKGIGMIETLFGIFKKEGALALYKGYAPAATRAIVNSSCAVGLYKPILAVINDNPSSSQVTPLKFKVLASLTSGAITQIFASPVDVLKVHLQANKGKNLEATHTIALKLLEQKGIAFFWTALRASMVRSALGVCATLATYDHAKDFISVEKKLLDEGLALHFVCSALSGLAATIVSCPADVIKTRMIVYHAQEKRSTLGWFKHIVRTEGVKALFTGFVPIYISFHFVYMERDFKNQFTIPNSVLVICQDCFQTAQNLCREFIRQQQIKSLF